MEIFQEDPGHPFNKSRIRPEKWTGILQSSIANCHPANFYLEYNFLLFDASLVGEK